MMILESVVKVIEHVAEEICTNYCKYPEQAEDHDDWENKTCNGENEICNNCPLNKLI